MAFVNGFYDIDAKMNQKQYEMNKSCEGCMYAKVTEIIGCAKQKRLLYCDYLLMERKRRPCPGGKDCTVYTPETDDGKNFDPLNEE